MNFPDSTSRPGELVITDAIRDAAADWVVRRDRGLSAAEFEAFLTWQQSDPRHAVALAQADADWTLLDQFPGEPAPPVETGKSVDRIFARMAPLDAADRERAAEPNLSTGGGTRSGSSTRRSRLVNGCPVAAFSAAAALIAFVLWPRERASVPPSIDAVHTFAATNQVRPVSLADGSQVILNAGAVVLEKFSPAERTVRLLRGEAHFTVAKNPARPFVVRAGNARIRAVGTAFNVTLARDGVGVLVTEGRVSVETESGPRLPKVEVANPVPADASVATLAAGQHAKVTSVAGSMSFAAEVSTLDKRQIAESLAWQEPLLNLSGASLAEVAREFEQRTGRRIVFADTEVAKLRVGGFVRSDDPAGFLHVLQTNFRLSVEELPGGETIVRREK